MACNGAKQPMLSIAGTATATNNDDSVKGGKLQHCKTSPQPVDFIPLNHNGRSFSSIYIRLGIYFGVYLGAGTSCFWLLRDQIRGKRTNALVDSMYFCVVTMTTVGYGDLYPHGIFAKLVTSIFATVGMCLVGIVVKIAAGFLVEKQRMMLADALNTCRKLGPIDALKQLESTKINYRKCLISLVVMLGHALVGLFVLVGVEDMDFTDAVYCVSTTMTTVGYGDDTFSSSIGRLFGVFWISTGTSSVGQFLLYIAEVFTESQMRSVVKWMLTQKIAKTADFDDEKVIGAADFIIYKLREMGKISQEDIAFAMKGAEFIHQLPI